MVRIRLRQTITGVGNGGGETVNPSLKGRDRACRRCPIEHHILLVAGIGDADHAEGAGRAGVAAASDGAEGGQIGAACAAEPAKQIDERPGLVGFPERIGEINRPDETQIDGSTRSDGKRAAGNIEGVEGGAAPGR